MPMRPLKIKNVDLPSKTDDKPDMILLIVPCTIPHAQNPPKKKRPKTAHKINWIRPLGSKIGTMRICVTTNKIA